MSVFAIIVCISVPVLTGIGVVFAIKLIPKKWEGTPATEFEHLKCTACRGGVQGIFTRNGEQSRGWDRLTDDILLLNRRPDSEGGDTWGSPMANIRDCACCQGKGVHIVAPDQPASWLKCPRPPGEEEERRRRREK